MSNVQNATVNYLADTSVRPQVWNEDFSRNILPLQSVEVDIEDASMRAEAPSLDVEGFALIKHKSKISDLTDPEYSAEHRLELQALLLDLTGADHVDVGDVGVVRRSHDRPAGDTGVPVPFVHCDTSVAGMPAMLAWAYPPIDRPVRRTALYNFWRLLSPGPTRLPLAVCDARTVGADDLVPGSSHFLTYDFTNEAIFVRPNEGHRWYYFSEMGLDDVLVFKQFDSDGGQPCQVPHSAFEHAAIPSAPRISVEYRAVAYWYED